MGNKRWYDEIVEYEKGGHNHNWCNFSATRVPMIREPFRGGEIWNYPLMKSS